MPNEIQQILNALTLEQKVLLVSGKNFWETQEFPEVGLSSIMMSDGPIGIRGERFDERDDSIALPSASALAATWSRDRAIQFGQVLGSEARDKKVHVNLAPTLNIHRTPLGGRHFESFSEDPILTGEIATAVVEGIQSQGVAATPKHYVANDSETERFTVDVVVDEQTLYEVYLRPFEMVVKKGRPWALMSAYNSVNGQTMHNSDLLTDPLKTKWNFDGVVVSDWTAVRSVESANSGQDIAMPGPQTPWSDGLLQAVRSGEVSEAALDDKVLRILTLAKRVGALREHPAQRTAQILSVDDRIRLAREISAEGTVVLENNGFLPFPSDAPPRIAVIGDNAKRVRTQGGGSATVFPKQEVSPLEGITAKFKNSKVSYSVGAEVVQGVFPFNKDEIYNYESKTPGAKVTFRDASGVTLGSEDRLGTFFIWNNILPPGTTTIDVDFDLTTPERQISIGCATTGRAVFTIDGKEAWTHDDQSHLEDVGAALFSPPFSSTTISTSPGKPHRVNLHYTIGDFGHPGLVGLQLGYVSANRDPKELIAEAVNLAAASDVAVVVVGTNSVVESEGYDRENIDLPGYQNDLVFAVAQANPNTVVIVNAGSPVAMPWRHEVAALLVSWFGGQEIGNAIAEILAGDSEPSGKLPTTWLEGQSLLSGIPDSNNQLNYKEGLNVGYKYWMSKEIQPSYAFGHGLGYASWSMSSVTLEPGERWQIAVVLADITNTSKRSGSTVVQVYIKKADSKFNRPIIWLGGFQRADLLPGESGVVSIPLEVNVFENWNPDTHEWNLESGSYELHIGFSSDDIRLHSTIVI